jgi:hypothetical protein
MCISITENVTHFIHTHYLRTTVIDQYYMQEEVENRFNSKNVHYKEDEMGGACGAHGGVEGCIQHFDWEV